ncbi:MAG TPA: cytochrome P460 family protein [Gemmatimonadales bacterium]|nr:cytochrome P460 family protein [Gemmatimonadales bacterium]
MQRIPRAAIRSIAGVILTVLAVFAWRPGAQGTPSPPEDQLPHFTTDGALMPPVGWETWVMVGSSIGLSYNQGAPPAAGAAPGMFHNVYMQPWAYRAFVQTGAFPEQTMFVLTFYEASRKSAPARVGFYEGDRQPGYEVHTKKKGIDPSGWAFFGFAGGTAVGQKLPGTAPCYSCHATEAAHDNVFTQFYPPLRERLARTTP